jgi:hypothetical protein
MAAAMHGRRLIFEVISIFLPEFDRCAGQTLSHTHGISVFIGRPLSRACLRSTDQPL